MVIDNAKACGKYGHLFDIYSCISVEVPLVYSRILNLRFSTMSYTKQIYTFGNQTAILCNFFCFNEAHKTIVE